MKIKVLGDRVLCKAVSEEPKEGDLIIPGKTATDWYVVVSVGNDVLSIKPNDKVLLSEYAQDLEFNGEKFKIVREDEIEAMEG